MLAIQLMPRVKRLRLPYGKVETTSQGTCFEASRRIRLHKISSDLNCSVETANTFQQLDRDSTDLTAKEPQHSIPIDE